MWPKQDYLEQNTSENVEARKKSDDEAKVVEDAKCEAEKASFLWKGMD